MALHNLKIVIVDGGRNGSYKSRNSGTESSDGKKQDYKNTPLYKILNAKQTIKEKAQSGLSSAQVFAMNMGVRVASQIIKQTANYYISDIGRKTGDSNYQSIINRQIEIASDYLGLGGSILSGAATGSMFGPVGAGVGAVVGAISSAVSTGFKYKEREREYQHQMFQQNNNQAYNIARANFNALSGRVR